MLAPVELDSGSFASGSMERTHSASSRDGPLPSPTFSAPSSPRSPIRGVPLHSPQPALVHKRSNLRISSTFDSPPSASSSSVPAPPSPSAAAAMAGMSISRPRRPSQLLHEIQPPARRLSAHQVLLLTPFGGASPPNQRMSLPGESSAMSLSPSSMGHILPPALLQREDTAWTRPSARQRHSSLIAQTAPPMVGSRPMATIPSNLDGSGATVSADPSRQPSRENPDEEVFSPGSPMSTVAMTRSNSLPVLTLRELDALKEKDEELGINRGGSWAWVSRPDDEESIPSPSTSFANSSQQSSAVSMDAITPPAIPWAFADPFASRTPPLSATGRSPRHPGVGREIAPFTHQYQPVSTTEGYHYSPTWNDRRMSETPSLHSLTSAAHASGSGYTSPATSSRRPSMPAGHMASDLSRLSHVHATPRASHSSYTGERERLPEVPQPPATPSVPLAPIATRPRLMRYKTSPSPRNGLGLEIKVLPNAPDQPSRRGSSTRRESVASSSGESAPRRSRPTSIRGGWAPIEVIDPLELDLEADVSTRSQKSGSISTASSKRTSISVAHSSGSAHNLVMFGKSFPAVDEFGKSLEGGRQRFDSVDSAMPRQAVEMIVQRGGSLAVLDHNKGVRRSWHVASTAWPAAVPPGVVAGGWQERRGSWAESWSRD